MPYLRNLENVQSNGGGEFHICAKRSISSAYDEVQIFYGKVIVRQDSIEKILPGPGMRIAAEPQ